jgi:hypothetical protein
MSQNFESARPTGHRWLWRALAPIAATKSPNYVQLDWRKLKAEDMAESRQRDEGVLFQRFEADPEAGKFLSQARLVGITAIPKDSLEEAERANPELRQAVITHAGPFGIVAGMLPDGISFGEHPEDPNYLLIGGRILDGPLLMVPTLWKPGHRPVEPAGVTKLDVYDIDEVPRLLPDMPIV